MSEGILKDILDIGKDMSVLLKDGILKGKNKNNVSLSRGAKKGTLQFPVIASQSLSLEDINMGSKALERQFVSFVQVVTSMNSSTKEKTVEQYLRSIHQNVEIEDQEIGTRLVKGIMPVVESAKFINDFNAMDSFNTSLLENVEDFVNVSTSELSLGEKVSYLNKVAELCEGYEIYRNSDKVFAMKDNYVKEIFLMESVDDDTMAIYESKELPLGFKFVNESISICETAIKADLERASKEELYPFVESVLNDLSTASKIVSVTDSRGAAISRPRNITTALSEAGNTGGAKTASAGKQANTTSMSMLMPNDIKKANELVPTMMKLTTAFTDANGKVLRTESYIIGIKTIIHSVSTESMMKNLVSAVRSDRAFHKALKYTTGEISFFKDFLFAINDIKGEVQSKYDDNIWWATLRKRQRASRALNRVGINGLLPNSSIICTRDEIESIKAIDKIDFEDMTVAASLMKSYHMLAFVIMDPSTETAKFMFDGDRGFREYSYVALEKENSNAAKDVKNIMQVLGRS